MTRTLEYIPLCSGGKPADTDSFNMAAFNFMRRGQTTVCATLASKPCASYFVWLFRLMNGASQKAFTIYEAVSIAIILQLALFHRLKELKPEHGNSASRGRKNARELQLIAA